MDVIFWLTALAAAISALIAGFFYACSILLMPALARRPDAEGMATMQTINVVVLKPAFLFPFFGAAVLGLIAAIAALLRWDAEGSPLLITAGLAYLLGCFGVTLACNVPLNNRLAAADARDSAAIDLWRHYLRVWTRWNHVRTAFSALAAILFVAAL